MKTRAIAKTKRKVGQKSVINNKIKSSKKELLILQSIISEDNVNLTVKPMKKVEEKVDLELKKESSTMVTALVSKRPRLTPQNKYSDPNSISVPMPASPEAVEYGDPRGLSTIFEDNQRRFRRCDHLPTERSLKTFSSDYRNPSKAKFVYFAQFTII